jgi:hypothetical protein
MIPPSVSQRACIGAKPEGRAGRHQLVSHEKPVSTRRPSITPQRTAYCEAVIYLVQRKAQSQTCTTSLSSWTLGSRDLGTTLSRSCWVCVHVPSRPLLAATQHEKHPLPPNRFLVDPAPARQIRYAIQHAPGSARQSAMESALSPPRLIYTALSTAPPPTAHELGKAPRRAPFSAPA